MVIQGKLIMTRTIFLLKYIFLFFIVYISPSRLLFNKRRKYKKHVFSSEVTVDDMKSHIVEVSVCLLSEEQRQMYFVLLINENVSSLNPLTTCR